MAAALTGSVDTSSRCRVPRYAAAGIRALLKRCGGFLLKLDLDGAPRVDDAAALAAGDGRGGGGCCEHGGGEAGGGGEEDLCCSIQDGTQ